MVRTHAHQAACLTLLVCLVVPGCKRAVPPQTAASTGNQRPEPQQSSPEPRQSSPEPAVQPDFLGLADNEHRTIGDTHPDSAVSDVVNVTRVQDTTIQEYNRMKQDGGITAEENHGAFVYFAIETDRDIPFPDGSTAFVMVTERFRARRPADQ